jgi:hypothetical protein
MLLTRVERRSAADRVTPAFFKSHEMYQDMNLYNAYFVSQGTGPRTVQIEALNQAGAKAQVEARYPGAYNIILNQLPPSAKKKGG